MLLFSIALLYFVYAVVLRDQAGTFGGKTLSLRGESSSTEESGYEEDENANWEPEQTPRNGYGGNVGPVKGGVEIYPLQVRPSI